FGLGREAWADHWAGAEGSGRSGLYWSCDRSCRLVGACKGNSILALWRLTARSSAAWILRHGAGRRGSARKYRPSLARLAARPDERSARRIGFGDGRVEMNCGLRHTIGGKEAF